MLRLVQLARRCKTNYKLIRNIGIAAHVDAGKTSTTECLLFNSGISKYKGSVDDGTTTTDFLQEERERGITIQSATVSYPYKNHTINVIDTPGHSEFTNEVESSMSVIDSLILVLCGSSGVETQTITVYKQMQRYNVPGLIFINKMDKDNANFKKVCTSVKKILKQEPILLNIPIDHKFQPYNGGPDFNGVIDLVDECIYFHDKVTDQHTKKDLTQETLPIFQEYREILLDQLSNYDEELLEKLIEEEPISPIFLREKLLQLVLSRQIMPILCGTAKNNINIFSLMDKINQILPNPIHGGSSDIQNILKSPIFKNYSIAQVFKINHDGPTFNVPISYFRVYKGNIKSSNLSLKIGMRREDNALSGGDANDAEAGQAGAVNPASGSSGFEIHQNDITFSPLKGSNLKLFKPFGNEHKSVIKIDLGEIGIIRNQPDLNSGDFIIQQNQGSAVESGVINKKLNLSQNEEKILYNIFTKSQIQEPLMYMTLEINDEKYRPEVLNKFLRYSKEDPGISVTEDENNNIMIGTIGKIQNEIYKSRFMREINKSRELKDLEVNFGALLLNNHERLEKLEDKTIEEDMLSTEIVSHGIKFKISLENNPDIYFNYVYRYQDADSDPNLQNLSKSDLIEDYKRQNLISPHKEIAPHQILLDADSLSKAVTMAGKNIFEANGSRDVLIGQFSKAVTSSVMRRLNLGINTEKPVKFPSWSQFKIEILKISVNKQNINSDSVEADQTKKTLKKALPRIPIFGSKIYRTDIYKAISAGLEQLFEDEYLSLYGPICNIEITVNHELKNLVTDHLIEQHNLRNLKYFEDNEEDDFHVTICGSVSLGCMENLSTEIRSLTKGKFSMNQDIGSFDKID